MDQVEQLQKKDKDFIIYFARDDCPACQRVDKKLMTNKKKLPKSIYRIETKSEKEQGKLHAFLNQNRIKKVPSFIQIKGKHEVKQLKLNHVLRER